MRKVAIIVVLLFFLLAAAPSTAEIKSVKIRSAESGRILLDTFEFTRTGHVSIAVSSVSFTFLPAFRFLPVNSKLSQPDPSRFGFFLVSDAARYKYDLESRPCDLDSKFISLLFTFQDLGNQSSFNNTYPVKYPNKYSLFFSNCYDFSTVTMDVRTEMYNMDNNGTTKSYIYPGMTKVPRLYFIFSHIYLWFVWIWMVVSFINRKSLCSVHWLIGVLLVMKGMGLLCAAKVQQSLKVAGTRSHGWDVLFYVFQFITPSLLYTVLAVIFGGSFFLKGEAKVFLMTVIPLQALTTVLLKVIWDTSDIEIEVLLGFGLVIFGIILYVCILFFLDGQLSDYLIASLTEQAATRNIKDKQHALLSLFLVVVGIYLLINIIMGWVNNMFSSYHWKSNLAEEIISLVFYILMFLVFLPSEKHPWFKYVEHEKGYSKDVKLEKGDSADVELALGYSADVKLKNGYSADVELEKGYSADVELEKVYSADVEVEKGYSADVELEGYSADAEIKNGYSAVPNEKV